MNRRILAIPLAIALVAIIGASLAPLFFESSGDAVRLPQHTGAVPQNGQPPSES